MGCPAQAWSVSCVLDVLYDMETMDSVTVKPAKSTEDDIVAPV